MWWRPVHIPAGTHLPSSPQRGSPVGCHITLCPQLVGLGREGEMLYFHVSLKRGRKKHRAAVCVNPAMPSAWPAGPISLPLPGESATSLDATCHSKQPYKEALLNQSFKELTKIPPSKPVAKLGLKQPHLSVCAHSPYTWYSGHPSLH